MEEPPLPFFYIVGYDGKKLTLRKHDGSTWDYPMRGKDWEHLQPAKEEVLKEHIAEKWDVLGIAEMKPKTAKILTLNRILL